MSLLDDFQIAQIGGPSMPTLLFIVHRIFAPKINFLQTK